MITTNTISLYCPYINTHNECVTTLIVADSHPLTRLYPVKKFGSSMNEDFVYHSENITNKDWVTAEFSLVYKGIIAYPALTSSHPSTREEVINLPHPNENPFQTCVKLGSGDQPCGRHATNTQTDCCY